MAKGYLPVRAQYAEMNLRERERRRANRAEGDPEVRDDEVFFELNKHQTCQKCGQAAFECLPGAGGLSICEDCADEAEAAANG